MKTREVVIVSACRTPIGKFMGQFENVTARDLAITAGKEAIRRAGIEASMIEDVAMGEVYSGMRALEVICNDIQLGKADIGLVIGVESMTNTPYLIPKARKGLRMGAGQIEDSLLHDALFDELSGGHMGLTAENVAEKYGITREECDELAVRSHVNACRAIEKGKFKDEIVPVVIKTRKGEVTIDTDEHPIRSCGCSRHEQ